MGGRERTVIWIVERFVSSIRLAGPWGLFEPRWLVVVVSVLVRAYFRTELTSSTGPFIHGHG